MTFFNRILLRLFSSEKRRNTFVKINYQKEQLTNIKVEFSKDKVQSSKNKLKKYESNCSNKMYIILGRGKKKKIVKSLIPLLLLLKLKFAALIPIALGVLAFLALKALVFGKIALVISAILGLQKLMGAKHQNYEVVGHGGHHEEHHDHGWGRSANWEQASDLAYNAYQPTN